MKAFDLAEAVGGRCQEDKFWISTELSHGEGVRSGQNGVICSHRHGTESKNLLDNQDVCWPGTVRRITVIDRFNCLRSLQRFPKYL